MIPTPLSPHPHPDINQPPPTYPIPPPSFLISIQWTRQLHHREIQKTHRARTAFWKLSGSTPYYTEMHTSFHIYAYIDYNKRKAKNMWFSLLLYIFWALHAQDWNYHPSWFWLAHYSVPSILVLLTFISCQLKQFSIFSC